MFAFFRCCFMCDIKEHFLSHNKYKKTFLKTMPNVNLQYHIALLSEINYSQTMNIQET